MHRTTCVWLYLPPHTHTHTTISRHEHNCVWNWVMSDRTSSSITALLPLVCVCVCTWNGSWDFKRFFFNVFLLNALTFYMFIYFGKIGLLDTRYFSKMKFPHVWLMLWCQDCTLLSWSSDVYAALGIFNCRLQFPWLKIALCVPVHSLTLWNVFGRCDTAVTNCRLWQQRCYHRTIYFLLFWSGDMFRSSPNITQVDMSMSMLLEGVQFCFLQLSDSHTQISC